MRTVDGGWTRPGHRDTPAGMGMHAVAPLVLAALGRAQVAAGARIAPVADAAVAAAGSSTRAASGQRQKIILPAVVCSTLVTLTSIVLPSAFRAWSTTTMVPSSR